MAAFAAAVMAVQGTQAPAQASGGGSDTVAHDPAAARRHGNTERLCGDPRPGELSCFGLRRTDVRPVEGLRKGSPDGFDPEALRSAYGLGADGGEGRTIAVVDAYDNPGAEADLAVYRQQYGLPACTTGNGCFTKIDQRGGTDYPAPDAGWASEISLDLDMVSAVAPRARILLVEADTPTVDDLGAAVDQAVAAGALYVSNSYGSDYVFSPEDPAESTNDVHWNHPGVAIVASAGDWGHGVSYPAASPYVTAVGGTSLTRDGSAPRGWSETAWGHDGAGTGSGCSRYEPKPAFQKDTGCAGRTVADVSAVADPDTGVAVYDTYGHSGWGVVGGTSASAPIIAGVYANAGAPVQGTYPNLYPYASAGRGLHDVTTGTNGTCSPSYLCNGAEGYDGPTGLGTPDSPAAFRLGDHGAITGRVTDRATGKPVAGAAIAAGIHTATTDADGAYSLTAVAGSYQLTVAVYGYSSGGPTAVTVGKDSTSVVDLTLRKLTTRRLSGQVLDGSGHGWPLHAKITVAGVPGAPLWSDPYTGAYRVDLPQKRAYTLRVTPDGPGYQTFTRTLTLGTKDTELALRAPADSWDTGNPAYSVAVRELATESFEVPAGSAPAGWTVVNAAGHRHGWQFDDPGSRGNYTGGSGGFAVADSDHYGVDEAQDTQLISPAYDFSGQGEPQLTFGTEYEGASAQRGDIDVSSDGGRTWTTVWHQDINWVSGRVVVPLTGLAGQRAGQFRFHFTSPGLFWAIDDVAVAQRVLTPVPGGVAAGIVTDANTGRGLVGATVSAGEHASTTTVSTSGDPELDDGYYRLFLPETAARSLTAAKPSYSAAAAPSRVERDEVVRVPYVLKAGRLTVSATALSATAAQGERVRRRVTVRNTGTATATLDLGERTGAGPVGGTGTSGGPAWRDLPDLPEPVMDNAVETYHGKVYSALGYGDDSLPSADLNVYDPAAGRWSALGSAPQPRQATAHGLIDGRIYTVGGWGPQEALSDTMQVYDIAGRTWSAGPAIPQTRFGSTGTALGGRLYVVGGCDYEDCTDAVHVFDPATSRWKKAADYPQSIVWASCGAITGKLYCAGGLHDFSYVSDQAYVYDPASDAWETVAAMPAGLWGGAYTAANGRLLVTGAYKRVGGEMRLTSEGYVYDPGTNTWSDLPDSGARVFRGGASPGMYRVGGSVDGAGPTPTAGVQMLPGYDQTEADVDWLSETPRHLSLKPGHSATFTVTLDAGKTAQPGTYSATVTTHSSTPYWVAPIAVTLRTRH